MRHAAIAVIASLFFTGCSSYWWLAPSLPISEVNHPNDPSSIDRTFRERPPPPSSEPVYGPDRASDAPDAKQQDESKAASNTP